MEFDQTELDVIEIACRAQANAYRNLAVKSDRPIQRNQRMDAAVELQIIRRGAAGRTDCCSRMAGLQGFSPLRETESWLVSFGKR